MKIKIELHLLYRSRVSSSTLLSASIINQFTECSMFCLLQSSSLVEKCETLLVACARSMSTMSIFYSAFTANPPPWPPMKTFPIPAISRPTWNTCASFTATSGRRDNQTSAVTTLRWALFASLGLEQSSSCRIRPFPTRSISECRSPPSNRMEFSYLRASRTGCRLLLMEFYRSAAFLRCFSKDCGPKRLCFCSLCFATANFVGNDYIRCLFVCLAGWLLVCKLL